MIERPVQRKQRPRQQVSNTTTGQQRSEASKLSRARSRSEYSRATVLKRGRALVPFPGTMLKCRAGCRQVRAGRQNTGYPDQPGHPFVGPAK